MKKQKGFTLVEIMIGMSVMALLVASFSDIIGMAIKWQMRVQNDDRMANIKVAVIEAYKQDLWNSWNLKSAAAPNRFRFFDGSFMVTGAATPISLNAISRFGTLSGNNLMNDAFNMPLNLYVSNWINLSVPGGANIAYQELAIVSGGENHVIEAGTTFNNATGQLILSGDDQGFTVGAASINQSLYNQAQTGVQKVATVMSTYFKGRFLNNASRDVSVDYFASTNPAGALAAAYDTGAPMPNSVPTGTCGMLPVSTAAVLTALGLSANEALSPFATPYQLVNSESAVAGCANFGLRFPDSASAALQTPPYTAKILLRLPGSISWVDNFVLNTTVTGDY